jgi:hypothetical protein
MSRNQRQPAKNFALPSTVGFVRGIGYTAGYEQATHEDQ